MLAYLFWHSPRDPEKMDEYEQRLVAFHTALQGVVVESAAFRIDQFPFKQAAGYEDWYLVEDWTALGELNHAAVSGARTAPHDAVAQLVGDGWGGLYRLSRGRSSAPDHGRWANKPKQETYESFLDRQEVESVWQRQLVLGPAAEFFLSGEPSNARSRIWPR